MVLLEPQTSVKTPLSDSDILKLLQDKSFMGSFSGVKNLQSFLLTDYGEHISLNRLYAILKKSPDYLMNLRPIRRFPKRHYQINSFGQLLEMDLGFMKKFKKFQYFLAVIDAFSWKIWAKPLASKTAKSIKNNLIVILDSIDSPITEITTDLGTEFIGNREFFKERHILFKPKYHQKNKAALAEHAVYEIKRKLYLMMRHYKTSNWVDLLEDAVSQLNSRPMTRNGGIPPGQINSFLQDPILRKARQEHSVQFPEPNLEDEVKQTETFNDSKPELSVGSYVFLDHKTKPFDKSFALQVSRVESLSSFMK